MIIMKRSDLRRLKGAEKRFLRCILFFIAPFAIALVSPFASIQDGYAHHTSGISYVFQKVGERTVGCFSIEMTATPPRLMWVDEKKISKKEKNKRLNRFTHRFLVAVRNKSDAKAVPGLRVRVKFSGDEWEKTFTLRPFTENGDSVYAANATLGPRGTYQVSVSLEGTRAPDCKKIRPGETLTAKLSFDNDYETLKEVMQALLSTLDQLGRAALTAGLDGEFVPPQKERRIRKLAKRLKELVPWTANLREGAAQELYEDRAARLLARLPYASALDASLGRAWRAGPSSKPTSQSIATRISSGISCGS